MGIEHAVVARTFYWPESPTELFKEFVERMAKPSMSGALSVGRKSGPRANQMPVEFRDYIAGLFENELEYPVQEWRFWIGVTLPDRPAKNAPEFSKGFPHSHGWDALTAVHYVQVADEGGDLLVVDENHNEIERFKAEVGKTAVIDGHSLHGVELVTGETARYTLIATGFANLGTP